MFDNIIELGLNIDGCEMVFLADFNFFCECFKIEQNSFTSWGLSW